MDDKNALTAAYNFKTANRFRRVYLGLQFQCYIRGARNKTIKGLEGRKPACLETNSSLTSPLCSVPDTTHYRFERAHNSELVDDMRVALYCSRALMTKKLLNVPPNCTRFQQITLQKRGEINGRLQIFVQAEHPMRILTPTPLHSTFPTYTHNAYPPLSIPTECNIGNMIVHRKRDTSSTYRQIEVSPMQSVNEKRTSSLIDDFLWLEII